MYICNWEEVITALASWVEEEGGGDEGRIKLSAAWLSGDH